MFKEVEIVKRESPNNKLTNVGKERGPQGVPLMQILGKTVADFAQLPKGRQVDDFPDTLAYFKSEDTLVMLRQRRPIDYGRGILHKTSKDGFFAEVFDVDKDGKPQNLFSNPVTLDGLFQKIEVTDEPNDPIFNSLRLTPTVFSGFIHKRLGEKMSNQPKALLSPGDENVGVIGQLFAQKQLIDIIKEGNQEEGRGIRKEIRDTYFNENSKQGLAKEVGNSHFVITEDENSQLVKASQKLGVETHVIKPDETWSIGGGVNPIVDFRDDNKLRPMLISVDRPSFKRNERDRFADIAIAQVINYAGESPLYNFIEWQNDASDSGVARLNEGWHILRGNEHKTTEKLLMKVGIDYLLTSKVRELAKELS